MLQPLLQGINHNFHKCLNTKNVINVLIGGDHIVILVVNGHFVKRWNVYILSLCDCHKQKKVEMSSVFP